LTENAVVDVDDSDLNVNLLEDDCSFQGVLIYLERKASPYS